MKILKLTLTLGLLAIPAVANTPAKQATKAAPVQKITVALPDGYKDAAATVKKGQPVALTFFLKSEAGCGDEVSVPAAKWKKTLAVGQKATVNFTPKVSGPLLFQCGMEHMKGTIIVK